MMRPDFAKRIFALLLAVVVLAPSAGAQIQVGPPQTTQTPDAATAGAAGQLPSTPTDRLRPDYLLGPGDQILIRAFEMPEMSERPFRIDGAGNANLPILGIVQVGGRTVAELEALLTERLKNYVREPQVSVTVVQFRSEPVFFVGAFQRPGIYALQGRRTLVEMISQIGGLQPNASRRIKVTRRKEIGTIPLSNAVESSDGKVATAEISMASLRQNVNPAEDIALMAFDVVSVDRAELVYVNGRVGRVGGFELGERESVSLTQLLTLAGGLGPDAAPKNAKILRPVLGTSRRAEIPVDITRVLNGKDSDFPVLPNDVLYVPQRSGLRQGLGRNLFFIVPTAVSVVTTIILATR
jgi:polysaccharide export outer membrane protein